MHVTREFKPLCAVECQRENAAASGLEISRLTEKDWRSWPGPPVQYRRLSLEQHSHNTPDRGDTNRGDYARSSDHVEIYRMHVFDEVRMTSQGRSIIRFLEDEIRQ